MCGIAGIFHFDRDQMASTELLARMCNTIVHRGPDEGGQHCHRNIAIGARRLSIIDVQGGHQPVSNEDGTIWVVLNGEIYNYQELRQGLLLKGHIFTTNSDTECVVHLYEEYGERCLDHLRGMFAFAVADLRTNSLFVARDRLGIKPLFYALANDRLVFGSEIKVILEDAAVQRDMDYSALDAYLTYGYIPAPMTIFQTIRKLEPGHYIKCELSGAKIYQYWALTFSPNYEKSEQDLAAEAFHLLDESVRLHLMSEVPLGVFLSGGIDSGMVVALMARHMTSPVAAFTMGFAGTLGSYLDERVYARQIASRYHLQYREFEVQPKLDEIIDFIVRAFDEPFADDSVVPTYYICKLARQHVTVALTGLGGDELFGGYERYIGLMLGQWYRHFPGPLTRVIQPVVHSLRETSTLSHRINHLKRFMRSFHDDPAKRYQGYLSILNHELKHELYGRANSPQAAGQLGIRYFNADNAQTLLDRAFYQDIKMYLPEDILALSDRLSMHHSLELRVPFVDHRLVEFCATIPSSLKVRLFQKKYLLKKIAKTFLPASTVKHRKQGFSSPMASWMRTDLRDYVQDLLSQANLSKHGLFRQNTVKRLLEEHIKGTESHHKVLFALMIFQRWYEAYA